MKLAAGIALASLAAVVISYFTFDAFLDRSNLLRELSERKQELGSLQSEMEILKLDSKTTPEDLDIVFSSPDTAHGPEELIAIIQGATGPEEVSVDKALAELGLTSAQQRALFVKDLVKQKIKLFLRQCHQISSENGLWSSGYCVDKPYVVAKAGKSVLTG